MKRFKEIVLMSITADLLKLFAIAFFFTTTIFLLCFINANYLHIVEGVNTPKTENMKLLGDEALLGIIATTVIFSGMLVYIFKKIVRDDLRKEFIKISKEERIASKVDAYLTQSFVLGWVHDLFLDGTGKTCHTSSSRKNCFVKSIKIFNLLEESIHFDEKGLQRLNDLDKKIHGDLHLRVKNNRLYNLGEKKKNYPEKMTALEEKQLVELYEELSKILFTNEYKKVETTTFDVIKRTCESIEKDILNKKPHQSDEV